MSEKFDPYYKWLGIPPKNQPPTHYRLLGIELFEPDREAIDSAANRLMAYLKTLSTGEDATHAQRLLNEAAVARRCLLDPKLKAAYDAQIREAKAAAKPAAAPSPRPALTSSAAAIEAARTRRAQQRIEAARKSQRMIWFASIAAGVAAATVWIGFALSSGGRNAAPPSSPGATSEKLSVAKPAEKAVEPVAVPRPPPPPMPVITPKPVAAKPVPPPKPSKPKKVKQPKKAPPPPATPKPPPSS